MEELRKRQHTPRARSAVPAPLAYAAVVVLGYGLFRGVNANSYLSAFASVEAPFLFVPDLFFNIVVACSVAMCSLAVIALVRAGKLPPFSLPFLFPAVLLFVGNLCALFDVFSFLPADMALLVPGLLFGAGSVLLSLVWIEALIVQRPGAIATQIALSMLVNILTSSALSTFSREGQIAASCVLLAVMVGCAALMRRMVREAKAAHGGCAQDKKPDAETACSECLGGGAFETSETLAFPPAKAPKGAYRKAFLDVGDSLAAFFVLEAVIGLLNSFMLAGSIRFEGSGSVSIAGMLCGILAFCIVVFVVQRTPLASTAFGVLMPIVAALLVFVPFLGERYNLFFYTVLLGCYYFIALLITYLIAVTSRRRGVSPYVLMGAAACIASVCLAVALVVGHAAGSASGGVFGQAEDTMRFLVVVVAAVYALSLAAVLVTRGKRRRRDVDAGETGRAREAFDREQIATNKGDAAISDDPAPTSEDAVPTAEQVLDERCRVVAREGCLTEREAEILGYLLRGRTKAHIASVLFVTENTVRSHVRNIYAKLGVHTRQELIDLVERRG